MRASNPERSVYLPGMKGLKSKGVVDLANFEKRVRRQFAMGRISQADYDFMTFHVDVMKKRIHEMPEDESPMSTVKEVLI